MIVCKEKTLRPCLVNLEGHLSLVAANGVDKGGFDIWVLQDSKSLFGLRNGVITCPSLILSELTM